MTAVMAAARLPFFDPSKTQPPKVAPDVGREDAANASTAKPSCPAPLSVSALILQIKGALAEAFPRLVAVVGEISNFKQHSSGHVYFRLKDAASAIDVAMWRQHASKLKFTPTDGLEVVVEGRVDVYDARGQLQLYALTIGVGVVAVIICMFIFGR